MYPSAYVTVLYHVIKCQLVDPLEQQYNHLHLHIYSLLFIIHILSRPNVSVLSIASSLSVVSSGPMSMTVSAGGGGPLVGPTNCLEVRVQGPIAGFRWGSGIHYWHRGIGRSACWSLEAQLFGSSGSHKVAGHMRISCDASPEHTGWEVVELLAIPATDFVSRDFINAICAGIAKIKQDSTTLLMTQVWQWAALDHTGFLGLLHIAVEFSLSQADNLGWYYWRHWPTWVTRPTANDYVTVIV